MKGSCGPPATWRRHAALGAVCVALALGGGLDAATFKRFDTPRFGQPFAVVAPPDGNLWFASNGEIGRMTPSGTVTNFDLQLSSAYGGSLIHGIAVGSDGNVWFTDHDENQVGRITPAGVVTKFQLPGDVFAGGPSGICAGPDGALWFTLDFADKIGRITTDGQITEFPLPPDPASGGLLPRAICAGPDGALWFAEQTATYAPRIGRMTTAGVVTTFPLPPASFPPLPAATWELGAISAGPDGNVWFTGVNAAQFATGSIARITPAGVVTSFPTAFRPAGLTVGADGNLWFTGEDNRVGKITMAGVVTSYPAAAFGGWPKGITSGPGGLLWFADFALSRIVSLTTAGVTTPSPVGSSNPQGIAFGPDGNVWFAEYYGKIARLTPGGVFTEFVLPDIAFHPSAIAAGADGNLWFLEGTFNQTNIGRITPAGVITEFPLPAGISAFALTAGPGGNVWFTENNITAGGSTARGVASIGPSGQITEFPVSGGGAAFFQIIAGGDGNLWFDTYGGKLVRMTPQGAATTFTVPGAPSIFESFAWGPDGNIWITTFDRVFRYQPGGAATPFTIPTPNADAGQIVSTSADLWFPEFQGSRLARISTSGVFTEFPMPGPYPYPRPSFLCVGSGGDVWMTEPNANRVWRFQVTEPTGFSTLPPCRVLDTRGPDGPTGGPVLSAGASRDFTIVGACGVPAGALSISANVTAVGATGSGYVGVFAGGGVDPQSPTVSLAGPGARANNALVQLSTDGTGRITVANHTSGTVHVVLDVNGFFQ